MQLFESNAEATIKRVQATFRERGGEYGDTWEDCQWLALRAVAKERGVTIPGDSLRAIAAAVLVDVKYQRLQGGWKDDSVIDGIAYQANLAEEMQPVKQPELAAKSEPNHPPPGTICGCIGCAFNRRISDRSPFLQ